MTIHTFNFKIVPCSKWANFRIIKGKPGVVVYHGTALPFARMLIGEAFFVPFDEYTEYERWHIDHAVWRLNTKLEKDKHYGKFLRLKHRLPVKTIEIARIR